MLNNGKKASSSGKKTFKYLICLSLYRFLGFRDSFSFLYKPAAYHIKLCSGIRCNSIKSVFITKALRKSCAYFIFTMYHKHLFKSVIK